jgi:23S rRNA (cytidine1920-2'-O)/16S rRNA (cytidine1409-2'-O)-methyltransferase
MMERGLFDSRAKARAAIEAGLVRADGVSSQALGHGRGARVDRASLAHPWVGRGALKLVHALDLWPIAVEGKIASTSAPRPAASPRCCCRAARPRSMRSMSGATSCTTAWSITIRVVDLSGSTPGPGRQLDRGRSGHHRQRRQLHLDDKALPAVMDLAVSGTEMVALIKPQFEAGREHVGKGGLVKDPETIARVHREIIEFLEDSDWTIMGRPRARSPAATVRSRA